MLIYLTFGVKIADASKSGVAQETLQNAVRRGLKQCPKTEISRVWICLEDSTIYSRLDLESDEFFYGPFIECSTDEFVV